MTLPEASAGPWTRTSINRSVEKSPTGVRITRRSSRAVRVVTVRVWEAVVSITWKAPESESRATGSEKVTSRLEATGTCTAPFFGRTSITFGGTVSSV